MLVEIEDNKTHALPFILTQLLLSVCLKCSDWLILQIIHHVFHVFQSLKHDLPLGMLKSPLLSTHEPMCPNNLGNAPKGLDNYR